MLPSATPEPTKDEAGEAADAVAGVCGLAAAIVEPAGVFDARPAARAASCAWLLPIDHLCAGQR